MRFTLVYKGCTESLKGVDPAMRFTLVYKGRGESSQGVDPSRIHRLKLTRVYKGCTESLGGCTPRKDSPHGVYIGLQRHLQRLR